MPEENGKPRFDRAEFLRQISKFPQVLVGSKDRDCALSFAALLISSVNEWMDDCERETDGDSKRIDRRISRRQQSGIVSFCRIDITSVIVGRNGGLFRIPKVNLSTDDNGVVQQFHFERDFAMLVADFVRSFSERSAKEGNPPIVISQEVEKFLAELHERTLADERHEDNERRFLCERYRDGYCAPCKFNCPHYQNGKCIEI